MLLITLYCCSVHVFFFPAFSLTVMERGHLKESAQISVNVRG